MDSRSSDRAKRAFILFSPSPVWRHHGDHLCELYPTGAEVPDRSLIHSKSSIDEARVANSNVHEESMEIEQLSIGVPANCSSKLIPSDAAPIKVSC